MSLFLGPIHFWLYEKIKRQEELTSAVSEYIGSGQDLTKNVRRSKKSLTRTIFMRPCKI